MDNNEIYDRVMKKIFEETDTSDIAYAPAMGFSGSYRVKLKKKRKKIKKPEELEEAIRESVEILKKQIIEQFRKIILNSQLTFVKDLDAFVVFQRKYNMRVLHVKDTIIRLDYMEQDLNDLVYSLPDDSGELEMILHSLENKESLSKFDIFKGDDYILSLDLYTKMSYAVYFSSFIDMKYRPVEYIELYNRDSLSRIEEEFGSDVKVKGRIVMPKSGIGFGFVLLNKLFEFIKEEG